VLSANTVRGEKMLGLTDPWIWSAYAGCIIAVGFCIVFGFIKGRGAEKEEDDE